ncbi:hypothetical protein KIN20_006361 [Parelaphostrongylus tenuis]|uniref:Uncharacterized protein n=1 Tax=Parelaphostrongylus tenuis TaxID=148309 RepID=A0AAD5M1N2_PARTN|nr:hypothetical protein KIN20_006361 [Parelaphostrongylus tenuis]
MLLNYQGNFALPQRCFAHEHCDKWLAKKLQIVIFMSSYRLSNESPLIGKSGNLLQTQGMQKDTVLSQIQRREEEECHMQEDDNEMNNK